MAPSLLRAAALLLMLLPVQRGSQSPQLCPAGPGTCSCSWVSSRLVMQCPAVTYLPSLARTSAGPVVQVLSLTQGCRVPSITQRQLYDHNLHNLQKIEMMHCQLRNIEENSFYYMEILQHINMSHNLLSRLESSQFSSLPALLSLDLSHNRLTVFGSSVLSNCPALRSLSLQGNSLSSLAPHFLPVQSLSSLQLGGNPWSCDCRLLHLRPLAPSVCPQSPLACPPSVAVSRPPGTSSLQCTATAWPRPRPLWRKDGALWLDSGAREEEDETVMPRLVTSTVSVSEPGRYSCHAGREAASLALTPEIFPHSGPRVSLGLVVGVSAGTAALLLLTLLLALLLLRQAGAKTGSATQDTGSMQYLHCPAAHTPRLSTPPPKPPRSYSKLPDPELQGLPLPSFPPPPDLQYLNTPGNRTSLGTVSLVSTYYEPTSWQLTSRGLPPGLATLPRKPLYSPLGPRTSGDGSSHASLAGRLALLNTCGLPERGWPVPELEVVGREPRMASPQSRTWILKTIEDADEESAE